jgi:hypothetical protein
MMSEYVGKIITDVKGLECGSDSVTITFEDGSTFKMWHSQDCCESVDIIDIEGDFAHSMIGAEWRGYEEYSSDAGRDVSESGTYTFYTLHTSKGYTWVRWLGVSNGYYSEGVSHGYYGLGVRKSYW